MTQYGFFFDQGRCTGCHTCALACKSSHALPAGPLKYLKIYEYEKGSFPSVRLHYHWIPCYHCENPACVPDCPTGALYKEPKYGAVLIDSNKCNGCRICYDSCPYGAPVFESDENGARARKCDMCIDRLTLGEPPVCVLSCRTRALDFGPFVSLKTKYGDCRDLEDMPSSRITGPAVLVKTHLPKRRLVPYDTRKAIAVMMRRDPLPPVFTLPSDVTEIPHGTIARSTLVLKHNTVAQMMQFTRNDEG